MVFVKVEKSEVEGVTTPPPSKSYTHRAFFAASLSREAEVINPLYSGDTISTLKACKFLGAKIDVGDGSRIDNEVKDGEVTKIRFKGVEKIDCEGYVNVENSGTTLRILLGLLAQSSKECIVDGDESLRKRPNKTLALALKKLGAKISSENEKYTAPIKIRGKIKSGELEMETESSQFVSSLLFTLPLCDGNSRLKVIKTKSWPYIEITLHVLTSAGVKVEYDVNYGNEFYIEGGQDYNLKSFEVPSDFSSASYLIAAGLIAGKVKLKGIFESKQGDRRIVEIAKEMGGKVKWDKENGILIAEKSELEGIEVDACDIPDLVPTIAVLGAVARGKTIIKNAEHLRYKEIDRISGCCKNLRALGIKAEEKRDGFVVIGGKIIGGTVNSFGDHRMALAFSLLGLVSEKGVKVENAEVVSISYPEYFKELEKLGAKISYGGD